MLRIPIRTGPSSIYRKLDAIPSLLTPPPFHPVKIHIPPLIGRTLPPLPVANGAARRAAPRQSVLHDVLVLRAGEVARDRDVGVGALGLVAGPQGRDGPGARVGEGVDGAAAGQGHLELADRVEREGRVLHVLGRDRAVHGGAFDERHEGPVVAEAVGGVGPAGVAGHFAVEVDKHVAAGSEVLPVWNRGC